MDKVFELSKLKKKIEEKKLLNLKVGLCHGSFDLLHIGHIKHFEEAKSKVDLLIVTVTPDRYVDKGPDRPIFNQNLRAEAVAALNAVDYVAINKWPSAVETINFLKPNLYIKGQDYKNSKLDISGMIEKEKEATERHGGSLYITISEKFSSSYLINNHITNLSNEQKSFLKNLKEKYNIQFISEFFEKIKNLNLLLIGESIIDEYVFCDTIGKSGKEPVLVNKKIFSDKYLGGILSVANTLDNFITSGYILSSLGEINKQTKFINSSLSKKFKFDFVIKSKTSTILKTRFVDRYTKTKILGVYDLKDQLLTDQEMERFNSKILNNITNKDIVIEMDYNHGLISNSTQDLITKKSSFLAINGQINSFNISFHNLNKYLGANYLCVNESEIRHHFRDKTSPIKELLIKLHSKLKLDYLVVTSGSSGSICIDKNKKVTSCPAFANKVVDRIGAGDTFIAISAICFVLDMPTDLVLFVATLAASEAVSTMGTNIKLDKYKLLKSIEVKLK